MKSLGIWGCATLLVAGALGCSQQDEAVAEREQFASCDDGRPSTFYVARDLPNAGQAAADGNNGFWLFKNNSSEGRGVVRVDHQGAVVEHLENPLDAKHSVESLVSTGDGGAVLSTKIWWSGIAGLEALGGPPSYPEVVRMDTAWTVRWRTPVGALGAGDTSLVVLPDGGVIVAGVASLAELQNAAANAEPSTTSPSPEDERGVFWARLSPAGEVLWQRFTGVVASLQGGRFLGPLALGTDGRVRLVVQSVDGLVVVSSDLDGEDGQEQLLATRLALSLVGAIALPDGRLAILSDRQSAILTLIESDGSVLWEKGYGHLQQVRPWAIAFNAARQEIVLGGEAYGEDVGDTRTWVLATGMDGEEIWSMQREPLDVGGTDGIIGEVDATRGPGVIGLAAAPDGTVLGAGFAGDQLSYFQFGAGGCP